MMEPFTHNGQFLIDCDVTIFEQDMQLSNYISNYGGMWRNLARFQCYAKIQPIQNNWVCDEAGKVPLAQALFFCGSIVGGIVLGYVADRFGRIPALILCNLTGALAGIITAFSTTFGLFAFSRFLMGIAFDNSFTLMYILGKEK
jgi:MFS family permease